MAIAERLILVVVLGLIGNSFVQSQADNAKPPVVNILSDSSCRYLKDKGYYPRWRELRKLCAAEFEPKCDTPLGLETGEIPDNSITASYHHDSYYAPSAARLHFEGNGIKRGCWSPKDGKSGEYLQIDLGQKTRIAGIATQGSPTVDEWTTRYKIRYSDQKRVVYCNSGRELIGNHDRNGVVRHDLDPPIEAIYIIIIPTRWKNYIALRVELYDCKKAEESQYSSCALGMQSGLIPDSRITASSFYRKVYPPSEARLNNKYESQIKSGAWGLLSPLRHGDWIQVDLGRVTVVTGIATQAAPQNARVGQISRYILKYSNNSLVFQDYQQAKVFEGPPTSMMRDNTRKHQLIPPITARYIKLYPVSWKEKNIGLRMELYGCKTKANRIGNINAKLRSGQ